MFIKSIFNGFKTLGHWEIWTGFAGISILSILFLYLIVLITMSDKNPDKNQGLGCFMFVIGGSLLEAVSVSAFILFLLPIMLGGDEFTSWTTIKGLWVFVLKKGILAYLLVLVTCLLPIVGDFVANIPGVATFIQGILILKAIILSFLRQHTTEVIAESVFPSFYHSIGYFVIALILCYSVMILIFIIKEKINEKRRPLDYLFRSYGYSQGPTTFDFYIMKFIGPIMGIMPLLMYSSYVALSIGELKG